MHYVDFTSLPPEDEAKFVVYEQRTQEASKKAMQIGAIVAGVIGLLLVIVVFSFDKPKNLMADDDIGMLGDKEDRSQQREDLKSAPTPSDTTPSDPTPSDPNATTPTDPGAGGAAPTPTDTPASPPAEAPATP